MFDCHHQKLMGTKPSAMMQQEMPFVAPKGKPASKESEFAAQPMVEKLRRLSSQADGGSEVF